MERVEERSTWSSIYEDEFIAQFKHPLAIEGFLSWMLNIQKPACCGVNYHCAFLNR